MNKPVLALALAATIAAAIFAPKDDADDVVAPVKPGNSQTSSPTSNASAASANSAAGAALNTHASASSNTGSSTVTSSLHIIPRHFDEVNGDKGMQDESKQAQGKSKKNPPEQSKENAAPGTTAVLSASWGGNLFASTNWQPPPPPPPPKSAKPPPPPPPSAPPLPFQFLGRWIEDGKVHYFLQYRERSLNVEVGAQIDQYKFDSAQHGQLRFIYLPLKEVQTIAVGEIN